MIIASVVISSVTLLLVLILMGAVGALDKRLQQVVRYLLAANRVEAQTRDWNEMLKKLSE